MILTYVLILLLLTIGFTVYIKIAKRTKKDDEKTFSEKDDLKSKEHNRQIDSGPKADDKIVCLTHFLKGPVKVTRVIGKTVSIIIEEDSYVVDISDICLILRDHEIIYKNLPVIVKKSKEFFDITYALLDIEVVSNTPFIRFKVGSAKKHFYHLVGLKNKEFESI